MINISDENKRRLDSLSEEEKKKATDFINEQLKADNFDDLLDDARRSSKAVANVKTTYDLMRNQFEGLSPQVVAMLTVAVMIAKENG